MWVGGRPCERASSVLACPAGQLELAVAADGRGDVDHAGTHKEGGPLSLVGQGVQALLIKQGLEVVQALAQRGGPVEALLQQGA